MIADPLFYAAAIPAVLIMGISKGGFGSGVGLLATPLLALTLPMSQAQEAFYRACYLMLLAVGLKLLWDGILG